MATRLSKFFNGSDNQIQAFEVGAEQVREMCGWQGRKCTGNLGVGLHCDSLAKGVWLVVFMYSELEFSDGCGVTKMRVSRPTILFTGNQRDVCWYLNMYYGGYSGHSLNGAMAFQVELWHLVDDGDLWHEWECRSAQYVALSDCDCTAVLQPDYLTLDAFLAMDPIDGYEIFCCYDALSQLRRAGQIFPTDDARIGCMPDREPVAISS